MNITILYERKTRELYNDLLLKMELESRGHKCIISQMYEADKFNIGENQPDVILAPHIYSTREIPRIWSRFGKCDKIINLQYEQILSYEQEKEKIFDPKGEAKKAYHVCWGENTHYRLLESGISENKLPILGAIQLDLLRKEFRPSNYEQKQKYSQRFGIDMKKKWIVFLSSFTYADAADAWVKMNENNVNASRENTRKLHSESRSEILDWFSYLLKDDNNFEIIYRPHPDENFLSVVNELKNKYNNFHIIRDEPVKNWINCCDYIYSWYSTSVVEAYYMKKKFSILRPVRIKEESEINFLKDMKFIESKEAFLDNIYYEDQIEELEGNKPLIESYYYVDVNETAIEKYADFIESVNKNNDCGFLISLKEKIKAEYKTFGVKIMYKLFQLLKKSINLIEYRKRTDNNYFIRWFIEMDNQICEEQEIYRLERELKEQYLNKRKQCNS